MKKMKKSLFGILILINLLLAIGCGDEASEFYARSSDEDKNTEEEEKHKLEESYENESKDENNEKSRNETNDVSNEKSSEEGSITDKDKIGEEKSLESELPEEVYVYVCGAVMNPGVYKLKSGQRIFEAIALAGGLTEEADTKLLNQAILLEDGMQITVYTKDEATHLEDQDISITKEEKQEHSEQGTNTDNDTSKDKVNINTADINELMKITGIGETRAQAIVSYRESNGTFQKVEDLMKVDGIKEGTFGKIKDYITVS